MLLGSMLASVDGAVYFLQLVRVLPDWMELAERRGETAAWWGGNVVDFDKNEKITSSISNNVLDLILTPADLRTLCVDSVPGVTPVRQYSHQLQEIERPYIFTGGLGLSNRLRAPFFPVPRPVAAFLALPNCRFPFPSVCVSVRRRKMRKALCPRD